MERNLPECDVCNQEIHDDHYYLINGDVICMFCMEEYFRKDVQEDE